MSDVRPPLPDGGAGPGGRSCDEVRDLAASFVLGALDADEMAAVRAHLAGCADAHAEMAELGSVLPVLDASVPVVEPPAALKGRLMAAAAADLAERTGPTPVAVADASAVAAPAAPEPTPFPSAGEREDRTAARKRTSPATWFVRVAAVLAIVVLGGWNVLLQGQVNASKTYEQNVADVLDVAAQPGSLTAILLPPGGSGPAGLAAVSSAGDVTMAMRDLDPTSGTEVYEAWVIGSDGVPVAIGGFTAGTSGNASFSASGLPTEAGMVLALTLEPAPGATAPSSAPVSAGPATPTAAG